MEANCAPAAPAAQPRPEIHVPLSVVRRRLELVRSEAKRWRSRAECRAVDAKVCRAREALCMELELWIRDLERAVR